jgi:hypothetical protein
LKFWVLWADFRGVWVIFLQNFVFLNSCLCSLLAISYSNFHFRFAPYNYVLPFIYFFFSFFLFYILCLYAFNDIYGLHIKKDFNKFHKDKKMTKHGSRQWEIWWPETQVRNEWCNRYQDVGSGYSMLCHPCSKFIFFESCTFDWIMVNL